MQVWILTFNRPYALSRLVGKLGRQGIRSNIFSNYPKINLDPDCRTFVQSSIINTLNSAESNSWCARSWNTMYMKCFDQHDEGVFIQDDTDISDDFIPWINEQKKRYDFIWGPAGDQFHFIKKPVLQRVGWWDERYIGCYCGDADYLKRVFYVYGSANISVEEGHNWGFYHNPSGVNQNVITTYEAKTIDPNYDNQHWQLERELCCGGRTDSNNPTLKYSQQHFRDKWGVDLDNGKPVVSSYSKQFNEIDWYPWFSKKHKIGIYQ